MRPYTVFKQCDLDSLVRWCTQTANLHTTKYIRRNLLLSEPFALRKTPTLLVNHIYWSQLSSPAPQQGLGKRGVFH